jgi:hypothetical protein
LYAAFRDTTVITSKRNIVKSQAMLEVWCKLGEQTKHGGFVFCGKNHCALCNHVAAYNPPHTVRAVFGSAQTEKEIQAKCAAEIEALKATVAARPLVCHVPQPSANMAQQVTTATPGTRFEEVE